ncbi:MAG: hypothetical protein ABIG70_12855 [Pseudomonadota bacterium]
MSAYIKRLAEAARTDQGVAARHLLEQRLQGWYSSLPEPTRERPFSMREFEAALKSQGRFISPVLIKLGWQRKRRWGSKGQYHRYWVLTK